MATRPATRCSSSSRASCAMRCARSIGPDGLAGKSSCSCSPAPCSTPPSRSRKGCANRSRHIHSRSTERRSAARRASEFRHGRIRASRTATCWCAPRMTRCTSPRRRAATRLSASTATNSTSTLRRKMAQTNEQPNPVPPQEAQSPPPPQSPTQAFDGRAEEVSRLRARVAELQRERDHLVAIVDILQEISSSLHFVDILQTIARKLGEACGLDRCAIFLSGEHQEVRLVASYEDPAIRNLVVDLNRYPELKRAL